ncbi:hypothetical protein [Novosphingobium sp.]|uniref:hypothetical protein n=1 Tax=Novosphingobium sp. TaxID=1874826 RepID=UPI002737316D|nr:hypothetical protein [Novosphingobium sp.]MDP3907464.1 hypothetical protein [Novosphingobium sp.]
MKVAINTPGQHDRHESEVRFVASVDGKPLSVTITDYALFIVGEALGLPPSEPLVIYAAGGSLLKCVVAEALKSRLELQATLLITDSDVLKVTGAEIGLPNVPKRWKL